jgi:hypothetical protein
MVCPLVVFPWLIPSGSGLFNGELDGRRERMTGWPEEVSVSPGIRWFWDIVVKLRFS